MDYERAIGKALKAGTGGDLDALQDCYAMIRALENEGASVLTDADGNAIAGLSGSFFDKANFERAHLLIKDLRSACNQLNRTGKGSNDVVDLYWKCHLFDAPYEFDSFCLYLEKDREEKKRFYLPRRKQLLPCVEAMQKLSDGKLDILGISEPPGIGKTTLAEFYLAFESGRHPDLPNLTGSHNNAFLAGVYGEMLRILDPTGEYKWRDIFPGERVVSTNAKDMLIDISDSKKRGKRFATLEFTSIGSGNAGKVRAMNLLYCDDLVDGIETAMSKERLDKLFQMYATDLRQRKQGDFVKELHIATRWSVHDVIGRLERQYEGNDRAMFIRFPALDENDESNFNYPYGLGYTTQMLHEQRDIMDDVSWRAIFLNEPVEREGTLYSPDELRYYFELPDREPDAVFGVVDVADGGGDSWVLLIVYQYGGDYYIHDVICDNGKPDIVEQRIIEKLLEHKVKMCQFESNRGAGRVAENVQKAIKERGGITKITTKYTTSNKETRIIVSSGFAKANFLFKDKSVYKDNKEYRTAMNFLTGYTMAGRNAHDDVPDAVSMLVDFISSFEMNRVEIMRRPF